MFNCLKLNYKIISSFELFSLFQTLVKLVIGRNALDGSWHPDLPVVLVLHNLQILEMLHVLNFVDHLVFHLGGSVVVEAQLGPSLSDFLPTFHTFLRRLMVNLLIHEFFVDFPEVVLQLCLQLGFGSLTLFFSPSIEFLNDFLSSVWVSRKRGTFGWGPFRLPVDFTELLQSSQIVLLKSHELAADYLNLVTLSIPWAEEENEPFSLLWA